MLQSTETKLSFCFLKVELKLGLWFKTFLFLQHFFHQHVSFLLSLSFQLIIHPFLFFSSALLFPINISSFSLEREQELSPLPFHLLFTSRLFIRSIFGLLSPLSFSAEVNRIVSERKKGWTQAVMRKWMSRARSNGTRFEWLSLPFCVLLSVPQFSEEGELIEICVLGPFSKKCFHIKWKKTYIV